MLFRVNALLFTLMYCASGQACLKSSKVAQPTVQIPKPTIISPPVALPTKPQALPVGRLTWNSFEQGGDGGGASQCTEKFHSDKTRVVALQTGIFANKATCGKNVKIFANGRSTTAIVVDQCDVNHGCLPGTVDATKAVWDDLGLNYDLGVVPCEFLIL
jgi:hypothetical protein